MEDRAIGVIYAIAIMLGAMLAGPFVIYFFSDGQIMRVRELFWVTGPIHIWSIIVLGVGAAIGATLGYCRLIELGKHLFEEKPERIWITVALWLVLISIIFITTTLYGQHAFY